MTPGSISDLTLSGAIAFRVRFEGFTPAAAQRYWRGPVMNGSTAAPGAWPAPACWPKCRIR